MTIFSVTMEDRAVREYRPEDEAYCGTLEEAGVDLAYYPSYQNANRRMHSVEVLLLSCVLAGTGTHFMGDTTYQESGASIGIVHYGQEHDIVTSTPMKIMNVFLDPLRHPLPEMPGRLAGVLPVLLPRHRGLGNRLNRMVHISIDNPQPLSDILFAMWRELREKPYGYESNSRHLLASFLILACRAADAEGLVRSSVPTEDQRIERVRRKIDTDFAADTSLDEFANSVGLSRSTLCRRFKRYTGKSVFTYLIDRRIEAALLELRASTDPVLDIALRVGFNDLAFFTRKFKQRIGMTPGAYRRRY